LWSGFIGFHFDGGYLATLGSLWYNRQAMIPNHIAIIPDGNRRWAKEKGLPSVEGHRRASETTQKLVDAAREIGVKAITFWAFSTENWNRSKEETDALFNLLRELIQRDKKVFLEKRIRFVHLGRKDRMPEDVVAKLREFEEETKGFDEFMVGLALDYGGHDELIRAFKKLNENNLEITEENFEKFLDTAVMPPVDLIIRTSGEQRLSGYLPWQGEYAELYFAKVKFPDFDGEELKKAVEEFSRRERRFGGN